MPSPKLNFIGVHLHMDFQRDKMIFLAEGEKISPSM